MSETDIRNVYEDYGPDEQFFGEDSAKFANATEELIELLSTRVATEEEHRKSKSKLERERESLHKKILGVSSDFDTLITDRFLDEFDLPIEWANIHGTTTVIGFMTTILSCPVGELEVRDVQEREIVAVRLLYHCKEWKISYPEGFLALAKALKPVLKTIGDPKKLTRLAEKYEDDF